MRAPLAFLAAALLSLPAQAATPIPNPPEVDARSYVVMDYGSGQVIAAQDPDARVVPASITKVMTAYIVFDELRAGRLSLDDRFEVSEKAWRVGTGGDRQSEMFLMVGETVTVDELLKGLIIQSGNDAAIALAEAVAGTEEAFADIMNQYAAQLGLEDTSFTNASGVPHPDHYSTAMDLVEMGRALIRDFPKMYALFAERDYQYKDFYPQANRNELLRTDPSVDGIKTGHTEDGGYSLLTSAERDGVRLITAVMGADDYDSRFASTRALLAYAFRFFEGHVLYVPGSEVSRARVWFGAQNEVSLTVDRPLAVVIPRGRYSDLQAEMDLDRRLEAPLTTETVVGRVRVSLDGEVVASAELRPVVEVPEAGLLDRLLDTVRLWFE